MTSKQKIKDISWILMLAFFGLTIYDIRFGVLGFLCMGLAMGFAIMGKKTYCGYCPRSSFINKLKILSKNTHAPKWLFSKTTKYFIVAYMMLMVILGIISAEKTAAGLGSVMFRSLGISSLVALLLGMLYKPSTWCAVCPITTIASARKK